MLEKGEEERTYNAGAVNACTKGARRCARLRDDGVGVVRTVLVGEGNGLGDRGHNLHTAGEREPSAVGIKKRRVQISLSMVIEDPPPRRTALTPLKSRPSPRRQARACRCAAREHSRNHRCPRPCHFHHPADPRHQCPTRGLVPRRLPPRAHQQR